MKDKFFVPFETAKLLKEKGYPQITDYVFFLGKIVLNCTNDEKCMELLGIIAAPTYHEVLDWFEGKRIRIEVRMGYRQNTQQWQWRGYVYVVEDEDFETSQLTDWCFTREESLNAAITEALELI